MIRKSRQCVINIPTVDLAETVVKIGNCSGRDVDKFGEFALTPKPGTHVRAPLIEECYANFECRLADAGWVKKYNLFVFEVVKAHVADLAEISEDHPLSRRRRVHDLGRRDPQISQAVPPGHALARPRPRSAPSSEAFG